MAGGIASAYHSLVNRFVRMTFPLWQKAGVHVTPNHFYCPIPDTSALPDDLFERRSSMVGIDLRDSDQFDLLDSFRQRFGAEYDAFPRDRTDVPHQYYAKNGLFGGVDAEVLYCMVRHFKPRRIYEIGSGNSTYVSAQAVRKNREEGHDCELVAFEPYPNDVLRKGFPGLARLEAKPVQAIDLAVFQQLEANDILFIDSSHVLKLGSDVQYEFLEILPRVNPGVVVHVHDIFLPYEMPREWVKQHQRFWTEQYVLQAFLTHNSAFQVLLANHYMHRAHPDKLSAAFKSYLPSVHPASFWFQRIAKPASIPQWEPEMEPALAGSD